MRVIWISIVLFAVVVIGGIGVYEPDAVSFKPTISSQSTAKQQIIENPFAEDVATASDVDLPALPQEQPVLPEPQETAVQAAPVNNVAVTEGDQISVSAPASKLLDKANQEAVEVSSVMSTQDSSDSTHTPVDQVASIEPQVVADKPQKLGLAMLELEKENKRNKIAVIVHADNPNEVTAEEIKAMYMDRLTHWKDGSKVMLYNLPLGDKHREKFSRNILNMTALEADSQEIRRRELHINVNPVEVKAKNIVVSYVEQDPNAVAYVPLLMVREKSRVKVIMTIP